MLDVAETAIRSGRMVTILVHTSTFASHVRGMLHDRGCPHSSFVVSLFQTYLRNGQLNEKTLEWKYPQNRGGEILLIDHAVFEDLYPAVVNHWSMFMNFEQTQVSEDPPANVSTARRMRFGRKS